MNVIGNILWLLLAGIWIAIGYLLAGVVNLVFIITIPFSIQSFKLAGYALWPFGRTVIRIPDRDAALSLIGNVIWFVTGGIWLSLGHLVAGALLAITVIGIPFALVEVRMARVALAPFGKRVVRAHDVPPGAVVIVGAPRQLGRTAPGSR